MLLLAAGTTGTANPPSICPMGPLSKPPTQLNPISASDKSTKEWLETPPWRWGAGEWRRFLSASLLRLTAHHHPSGTSAHCYPSHDPLTQQRSTKVIQAEPSLRAHMTQATQAKVMASFNKQDFSYTLPIYLSLPNLIKMMPLLVNKNNNNNNFNMGPPYQAPMFSTNMMETPLDKASQQYIAAHTRNMSRGYGGQRTNTSMRITKPSSASTSPRYPFSQSKRKTLIGDGFQNLYTQPAAAAYLPTPAAEFPVEFMYDPETKPTTTARPVSWHPSSQQVAYSQPYPQESTMAFAPYPSYQDFGACTQFQQLPPTPSVYSGSNSPCSASFSPLTLPYPSVDFQQSQHQYASPATQLYQPAPESPQSMAGMTGDLSYAAFSKAEGNVMGWTSYAPSSSGLDTYTAPPTPNNFELPEQFTNTKMASEEPISYEAPEDDESDGEILYGMGLYDPPETNEPADMDLHQSTVFSLLGNAAVYEKPSGKGLKLEDAWEPPASDDEEDNEEQEDDEEEEED
ncbi:uncharacterized protein B0T23DRAFT_409339 [Neurospora hispaniola]|uniref:Uncharacterized protein n=1 Tax=Neurospora hispaniola TaxID=588809 RepID=A0AAJ0IF78_9PEZI|nr:hypothetical protein B0T23DRAFT_409339 [Neurospora hispaniola]